MLKTLRTPPSEAETDAWHDVIAAAHLHDVPASVPEPGRTETAGKLRVQSPNGRVRHLVRAAPDGSYDGVAALLLFTEESNRHTAFLDALVVRPEARRRGVGAELWSAIRAELTADGRSSVSAMLELGGAGEAFVDGLGFTKVLPLAWYVQRVREADARLPEAQLPDGYRFAAWDGVVPDALADEFARAHDAMEDAPAGGMDERTPRWDAERVRNAARLVDDRGGVILTSVVLASADGAGRGTDRVAAYTEVVLRDPSHARALQYDTVVVPEHRGRGLGRAVKRHLLATLAELHPGVREISTSVADDNAPMLAVNAALGYRRERPAGIFQAKL
ncbi:GNAT family N-acetyltransferase [Streptomyces sp. NBC_01498]|uniref:GNAT family N-acetyltransferase n=1 Tax=Streptomyces sp. NBC_01498 TaxID=2975870 RepID=UPI002E7B5151|nr:GNAT family N-acetyltransferase [Streptomyces sp. NBC_01498]WTL24945.1 GNAT family N-acetyltransferase [Streptomyces sp. NBC_01498]